MPFTNKWFCPQQPHVLPLVSRAPRTGGAYIEIGCYEGRSTCAIANVIYPEILHAVDFFKYEPQVRATFEANVSELTKGNVDLHVQDWREFFAEWGQRPIAFIYIDGPHTYPEVYDTVALVQPLLSPGGIMVGDDWTWESVKNAVQAVLAQGVQSVSRTWWWENRPVS